MYHRYYVNGININFIEMPALVDLLQHQCRLYLTYGNSMSFLDITIR